MKRYWVSVKQKELMTGCVCRRKKMCIIFSDVYIDGRDVNKIIAQTNAYLVAHWLAGDLKWTLL